MIVALATSAALHAVLIVGVPVPQPAPTHPLIVPALEISARLKNTLDARRGRRGTGGGAGQAASGGPRLDNPRQFYPPEAIARGIEGETILMLKVGAQGELIDAKIAKTSGHRILDDAALRAVRAAAPLDAGPRELLLPVTFSLR